MYQGLPCIREVVHEDGDIIVRLSGEIDLHQSPAVHNVLVTACESRPARLIVDLEHVTYLDSSGIGTLVEIYRRVNGYGGMLALCAMADRVHSIFEITRLDHFFRIFATVAEARSA
jgi:anti-sigma B factor antagonist